MPYFYWYAIGFAATISGFFFCFADLPVDFFFSEASVREFGFGLFFSGLVAQGAVFLSLLQAKGVTKKTATDHSEVA